MSIKLPLPRPASQAKTACKPGIKPAPKAKAGQGVPAKPAPLNK